MSTPPRVTEEDALAAVQRISDRHAAADDPHLERFDSDPAAVLAYLRKYGPAMPESLRADDVMDAAVMHLWLWWQHQLRERWLFDTAERLGVNRAAFAKILGLGGRQGFRDRSRRAHRLTDGVTFTEPDALAPVRMWSEADRSAVVEVAEALLELGRFVPDEAAGDYLNDLRDDVDERRSVRSVAASVDAAVRALDRAPQIAAVTAWPQVRDHWRQLEIRAYEAV